MTRTYHTGRGLTTPDGYIDSTMVVRHGCENHRPRMGRPDYAEVWVISNEVRGPLSSDQPTRETSRIGGIRDVRRLVHVSVSFAWDSTRLCRTCRPLLLRLDGTTGLSVSWRAHADYHIAVLLSADGPFKDAAPTTATEPNSPHCPATSSSRVVLVSRLWSSRKPSTHCPSPPRP